MKLTDAFIKSLRNRDPAQASVLQSFADGKGLVLLAKNQTYMWRFRYRFDGKAKMISLGQYPEVTLKEARDKLHEVRKQLSIGIDPSADRKRVKDERRAVVENTFESVARRWHEAWSVGKNEDHIKRVMSRITENVFPKIGSLPIAEITPQQVIAMCRTVHERGATDVAQRCFSTSGQIFRWGIVEGVCKSNPIADITLSDAHIKAPPVKNQARLPESEIPELLQEIDAYNSKWGGRVTTQIALKLMAYTFLRTSELIGARWDEVDLKKGLLVIPASRMKQINSRLTFDHIVPLSTQAKALLEDLYKLTGHGEFLFPHDSNPKKTMSNNTILFGLYRMKFDGRMTGHGFRGIASTILHERGYEHAHIETQLSHLERDRVSGAYNHAMYLEPRKKMMQDYADILDALKKKKVKK